jgi:hypothetical protein
LFIVSGKSGKSGMIGASTDCAPCNLDPSRSTSLDGWFIVSRKKCHGSES